MTSAKLPPWPKERDFAAIDFGEGRGYAMGNGSNLTAYERARAEAAIARLRVAVDLLGEHEVLEAIGPLPDSP